MKILTQQEFDALVKYGEFRTEDSVEFLCDINARCNITARNINAQKLTAYNINTRRLTTLDVNAFNIFSKKYISAQVMRCDDVQTGDLVATAVYAGNVRAIDVTVLERGLLNTDNLDARHVTAGNVNSDFIDCANMDVFDIDAIELKAANVICHKVSVLDLKTAHLTAHDVDARNMITESINAHNVNYYGYCLSFGDIKCASISGRRANCKHISLDGAIKIKPDRQELPSISSSPETFFKRF